MMIKQRTGDLGEEGADAVHVKGHGEGRLFVKKKTFFGSVVVVLNGMGWFLWRVRCVSLW